MHHDDFDRALARHHGRIFTFATYLLSSRVEAEDVTQEVVLVNIAGEMDPELIGSLIRNADQLEGWCSEEPRWRCFGVWQTWRATSSTRTPGRYSTVSTGSRSFPTVPPAGA